MKLFKFLSTVILLAIAVVMLSTTGVRADTVSQGDWIAFTLAYGNAGGGGAFHVVKNGQVLYDTFCLETNEYFYPGTLYLIGSITGEAINGGKDPSPHPDPLDPRTAYLFYKFSTGTLTGYTVGDPASANALQKVIWYIEQELGNADWNHPEDYLSSGKERDFYNISLNNQGVLWGVQVLNMYGGYDATSGNPINLKQDQLVLVPEPSTILLLGAGLLGLGLLGRRKFKKYS